MNTAIPGCVMSASIASTAIRMSAAFFPARAGPGDLDQVDPVVGQSTLMPAEPGIRPVRVRATDRRVAVEPPTQQLRDRATLPRRPPTGPAHQVLEVDEHRHPRVRGIARQRLRHPEATGPANRHDRHHQSRLKYALHRAADDRIHIGHADQVCCRKA